MASESFRREKMQSVTHRSEYLGALLEDERRLVLVTVDPDEPWEAFRRLRKQLRKERGKATAKVDIFATREPLEHQADVISLESRRRAG